MVGKAVKINYQKILDNLIEEIERGGKVPSLFLHACCAPCSSYVLEYLSKYFQITVFFYNPNIWPEEEYHRRVAEMKDLVRKMHFTYPVTVEVGGYETKNFYSLARGLEDEPEKGERCRRCYEFRLRKTQELAAEKGFDYYCTTLSISPMKNAVWLNEIGETLEKEGGSCWLPSDFKKKEGYKRSIQLSEEYHLYRQDYCGCIFSKKERESQKEKMNLIHD